MPKDREALQEQLMNAQIQKGMLLAERWGKMSRSELRGFGSGGTIDFLRGVDEDRDRVILAQLYENTMNWLRGLDEATRTIQVGSFEKFIFPVLRALMANLVAADLVTVSPLDAPTGLVFYFDIIHASNKGRVTSGDKAFDVRTGPSHGFHYSDEIIEEEVCANGDGTDTYAPNLAYSPVRPGTLSITDGTQVVQDNGNGQLIGDGNGTVDYSGGAVAITFTNAVAADTPITAYYEYDSEANTGTPEVELQVTSAPVTARTNKLRARWSLEAQQDLKAYHGLDGEVELVSFMANMIAKELNYKIIRHIRAVAGAGQIAFNRTPPAGVPWIWHKEMLYDTLIEQSNMIYKATQRAHGNWIVGSIEFCNVAETLARFQPSGGLGNDLAGVVKCGTLGEFTIYKDPTFPENEWIMGHKGRNFMDTGYVHAPYLQVFMTDTVTLDNMVSQKGIGQRSAQKVINNKMYARGRVIPA